MSAAEYTEYLSTHSLTIVDVEQRFRRLQLQSAFISSTCVVRVLQMAKAQAQVHVAVDTEISYELGHFHCRPTSTQTAAAAAAVSREKVRC